MPLPPTDAWHEVGEFEIEDLSGKTTIVPVSVARDPSGCLFIKVADHEAGVERLGQRRTSWSGTSRTTARHT